MIITGGLIKSAMAATGMTRTGLALICFAMVVVVGWMAVASIKHGAKRERDLEIAERTTEVGEQINESESVVRDRIDDDRAASILREGAAFSGAVDPRDDSRGMEAGRPEDGGGDHGRTVRRHSDPHIVGLPFDGAGPILRDRLPGVSYDANNRGAGAPQDPLPKLPSRAEPPRHDVALGLRALNGATFREKLLVAVSVFTAASFLFGAFELQRLSNRIGQSFLHSYIWRVQAIMIGMSAIIFMVGLVGEIDTYFTIIPIGVTGIFAAATAFKLRANEGAVVRLGERISRLITTEVVRTTGREDAGA